MRARGAHCNVFLALLNTRTLRSGEKRPAVHRVPRGEGVGGVCVEGVTQEKNPRIFSYGKRLITADYC